MSEHPGLARAERREAQQHKARHGMRVGGRSTKTTLAQASAAPKKRRP